MSDDRFKREEELFTAARAVAPNARSAFLETACGGDAELRDRVKALLGWDELNTADTRLDAVEIAELDVEPGTRFGRYRIVELIGEGGFGVVYRAEQERPVRRAVALKIIKLGMDTRHVIARFDAERQALAMMDHPGIAQVFDAGATHRGRPYFVMELVDGVPVTSYCDERRLGLEDRLELFMHICAAVQHAHQKGVIHRDLKPSNVLVKGTNGDTLPKVIDFGIAKATNHRLTERTLVTERGQLVGTPAYMSPEQAESAGADIDTRSDIYSLGVLLYELLTGTTPFDSQTFERLPYPEIQRIIREAEPPTPSTRAIRLGEGLADVARYRDVDPASLPRLLRGDLDWIVMRALDKDRTRRYGTASELAEDLRRYLRHEPVHASPPGTVYKMRKFARRHRIGVAAGTAVALALLIGLGGMSWTLAWALHERAAARTEAETATKVSEFLADLFAAATPGDDDVVTVRTLLDDGVDRITMDPTLPPQVRGRLMVVMGETYRGLGHLEEARALHEEALQLLRTELGDDHAEVARAFLTLGWTIMRSGEEMSAARSVLEEAIEVHRRAFGPDHPDTANAEWRLAGVLRDTGDYEAARELYEDALAVHEDAYGSDSTRVAATLNSLGELLMNMGDLDAARSLQQRALRILDSYPSKRDSVDITYILIDLGTVLIETGDYEAARPLLERNLAIRESRFGSDHTHTAWALMILGRLLTRTGAYDEAEALLGRALAVFESTGHNDVARASSEYGALLIETGDYEGAGELLERAWRIIEETYAPGDPQRALTLHRLAVLHRERSAYDLAEPLFEEALRMLEAVLESDNHWIAALLHDQAVQYRMQGRHDDAIPLLERALAYRERALSSGHPDVIASLDELDRIRQMRPLPP